MTHRPDVLREARRDAPPQRYKWTLFKTNGVVSGFRFSVRNLPSEMHNYIQRVKFELYLVDGQQIYPKEMQRWYLKIINFDADEDVEEIINLKTITDCIEMDKVFLLVYEQRSNYDQYNDDIVHKVEIPFEMKDELDNFLNLYYNNETLDGIIADDHKNPDWVEYARRIRNKILEHRQLQLNKVRAHRQGQRSNKNSHVLRQKARLYM